MPSSCYLSLAECRTTAAHEKCELLQDLFVGSIIPAFKSEKKKSFFSDPDETYLMKELLIYNPAILLEEKGYL